MELDYNSGEGGSTTATSEASIYNNIPLTVLELFTNVNNNNNKKNNIISNNNDTSLCYSSLSYDFELSSLPSLKYLSTNYSGARKKKCVFLHFMLKTSCLKW